MTKLKRRYQYLLSTVYACYLSLFAANLFAIGFTLSQPHISKTFLLSLLIGNISLVLLSSLFLYSLHRLRGLDHNKHKSSKQEAQLLIKLKNAIEQDALELYYQPILSLEKGEIIELEPCLRWKHPEKGYISPIVFLNLAKKNELMGRLTQVILKQSIRQLKKWHQNNYPIQLTLNLENLTFDHINFQYLKKLIKKNDYDPSHLSIQVSEKLLNFYPDLLKSELKEIKNYGAKLTLQNFNLSHSNLESLKNWPFDKVKIETQLIHDAVSNTEYEKSLCFMVDFAKKMDLRVHSEGVESREHLYLLRNIQCDHAQGFFFSPPLPASELDSLLNTPENLLKLINKNPPKPSKI